ncbi:hypothetical protein TNCT_710161, partial [Trichonephila clavata]
MKYIDDLERTFNKVYQTRVTINSCEISINEKRAFTNIQKSIPEYHEHQLTPQEKEKSLKSFLDHPENLFGKWIYCFVVTYRREGSKHYEMKAETEVECMGWIRAIDIA